MARIAAKASEIAESKVSRAFRAYEASGGPNKSSK
jgi:hypothetical protein